MADQETQHKLTSSWKRIVISGLVSLLLFGALLYFLEKIDGSLGLVQVSKAVAVVSALFYGASFSMSSLCYYFDFVDDKIRNRKLWGLLAYYYSLVYVVLVLYLDPERYFYGFFENFWSYDIFLGSASMLIFTIMALTSNKASMLKIGPHRWRRLMRLGFLAWFLLVVRAIALEWDIWKNWWQTLEGFPPPRLLLSIFVLVVISLRISVTCSKLLKKTKTRFDQVKEGREN